MFRRAPYIEKTGHLLIFFKCFAGNEQIHGLCVLTFRTDSILSGKQVSFKLLKNAMHNYRASLTHFCYTTL